MANAYTTFPDSVQRFDLKTDVSSSVYADWKQFNTYIANGQFANAATLLQNNTELQKCIIDGNYMNSVSKTLEEVEDLFLNQIQTYIHETVIEKGVWSATTKYTKYNFVTYDLNGIIQTYECLRDDTPIGIAPTNTTYWVPRVIRGEKGDPGIGLSPRGVYSETTVYFQYDLVLYGDQLWYTIKDNPSGVPSDTNADWRSFFMFNGASVAYDNSISRLNSVTVQGAIDEVSSRTQALNQGGTGATNATQARANLGVAYGTTAGTVCQGNDSRLSDARTPLAHTHTISAITNFPTTMTPTAHNQAASTITAGTFAGQVVAPADTEYNTARMRNIAFTTADPGANTASSLPNGSVLIVYE